MNEIPNATLPENMSYASPYMNVCVCVCQVSPNMNVCVCVCVSGLS